MLYNIRECWEFIDKLGIVSRVSVPLKRYYLLEKSHNQGDNLLIIGQ